MRTKAVVLLTGPPLEVCGAEEKENSTIKHNKYLYINIPVMCLACRVRICYLVLCYRYSCKKLAVVCRSVVRGRHCYCKRIYNGV